MVAENIGSPGADVYGSPGPRRGPWLIRARGRMADVEINFAEVGKGVRSVVVPMAAIGLLLGIFIQAGRLVERWDQVNKNVTSLLDPNNPVLRKQDLVILSNQYTTLAAQLEGYRFETQTTQAYVNALRVDLARRGVDTSAPPWEGRRFIITDQPPSPKKGASQ